MWRYTVCALALVASVALADVAIPPLTGPVVDDAQVFSLGERAAIEAKLASFQKHTGVTMAVLTVMSLGDEAIEQFAIRVTDSWKLGTKGNDRGILFLFVPSARKMRLEIGYGLEGDVPDAIAKRLTSTLVAPYFKQKRFADGVEALVNSLETRVGGGAQGDEIVEKKKPFGAGDIFFFLLLIVAFVVVTFGRLLGLVPRHSMRRRGKSPFGGSGWSGGWGGGSGWSGGSSSGSGWSGGGGGGFGGGGSSSNW